MPLVKLEALFDAIIRIHIFCWLLTNLTISSLVELILDGLRADINSAECVVVARVPNVKVCRRTIEVPPFSLFILAFTDAIVVNFFGLSRLSFGETTTKSSELDVDAERIRKLSLLEDWICQLAGGDTSFDWLLCRTVCRCIVWNKAGEIPLDDNDELDWPVLIEDVWLEVVWLVFVFNCDCFDKIIRLITL